MKVRRVWLNSGPHGQWGVAAEHGRALGIDMPMHQWIELARKHNFGTERRGDGCMWVHAAYAVALPDVPIRVADVVSLMEGRQ